MKKYFYVSSALAFSNSVDIFDNLYYYSAYSIFNKIGKLNYCFNISNNFLYLIFKIQFIKKIIDDFIGNVEINSQFIFTANGYDIFSFLLMEKLIKKNKNIRVVIMDPKRELFYWRNITKYLNYFSLKYILINYFKSFIKLVSIRLLYNVKLYIIVGHDITVGIPYNLNNPIVEVIDYKFKRRTLKYNCNDLILYANPIENEFLKHLDVDSYKFLINKISNSKNFIIKLHPRDPGISIFDNLFKLSHQRLTDDQIGNIRCVIGVNSTLLFELGLYYHIRVISIIYLLNWKHSKEMNRSKIFMDNENSRFNINIFYPKTFMELQKLCET